jgi:hypothetical protein
MLAPSYLRQIAARGSAESRGTTLVPRRMLFRPIPPSAVLALEAETEIAAPSRSAIPEPDSQAAIEIRVPSPPMAAPRPESPQSEGARPGRASIAQPEVLPPREQGVRRDPVQREAPAAKPAPTVVTAGPARPRTADRDPASARAPGPSADARASFPIPLQRSTGSGEIAARAVASAPRDPYPTLAPEQPAPQTLRPLSPSGDLHGRALRDPEVARTGSAENIVAREERILLTPPVDHGPRRGSSLPDTRMARSPASGGLHIGSLEVHVTAPPPVIAPPLPPPPQATTPSGRAVAPLARGFRSFGLVQS